MAKIMFTGIIEELGIITNITAVSSGIKLIVKAREVLSDVKLGDSISINGACQTVIAFNDSSFEVEVSSETLNVTTFKNLKSGDVVNLERAMRLGDRLGGHMVSGHVDGTGTLLNIKSDGIAQIYTFSAPENVARYIIYKGSICINGISLTISNTKNNGIEFSVTVIPHTLKNTNLYNLPVGSIVNLESDLIAKYIEKFLLSRDHNEHKESKITYDFLSNHGFM